MKIYAAAVEALRKKETGFFAGFCFISPGFGTNSEFWCCVFLLLRKTLIFEEYTMVPIPISHLSNWEFRSWCSSSKKKFSSLKMSPTYWLELVVLSHHIRYLQTLVQSQLKLAQKTCYQGALQAEHLPMGRAHNRDIHKLHQTPWVLSLRGCSYKNNNKKVHCI